MASSSAALYFTFWNSLSLNLGQGVFKALPIFVCWAGGSQPFHIVWLFICVLGIWGWISQQALVQPDQLPGCWASVLLLLLLFLVSVLQLCHLLSVEQASRTTVPRTAVISYSLCVLLHTSRVPPPGMPSPAKREQMVWFCFALFFCNVSEFSSAKSNVDFIEVPSASNTSEPGTVKQCKQL